MKPCPNCQQPVSPGTKLCPNCGADTRPLWDHAAGAGLLQIDLPDLNARKRGDRRAQVCGFLVGLLIGTCTFPFGFLILLLIWAANDRSNPYFAKGIKSGGWTVAIGFCLLLLGIFAMCARTALTLD